MVGEVGKQQSQSNNHPSQFPLHWFPSQVIPLMFPISILIFLYMRRRWLKAVTISLLFPAQFPSHQVSPLRFPLSWCPDLFVCMGNVFLWMHVWTTGKKDTAIVSQPPATLTAATSRCTTLCCVLSTAPLTLYTPSTQLLQHIQQFTSNLLILKGPW